jgi:hypothetical protein
MSRALPYQATRKCSPRREWSAPTPAIFCLRPIAELSFLSSQLVVVGTRNSMRSFQRASALERRGIPLPADLASLYILQHNDYRSDIERRVQEGAEMADYFTRVELHGAAWPDGYRTLHAALAKHGFTNCVLSGTGSNLRLPTGFYYSTNRIDDDALVARAVKQCADSTGYKNEVIVIKNGGWSAFLSANC